MLTKINLNLRNLMAASLALVGLICVTLLITFNQWRHDWQLAHSTPPTVNTQSGLTVAQLIADLPSDHIFGKSFADGGDMPISSLQLKVTGIMEFKDTDGNDASKAMISMADEPSKLYQKGDELPYGVKVYSITRDAVILENDGHLEKLPLPRETLQFKPRASEEEDINAEI